MNKKSDNETKTNGSELKQFVFLTIILYCFWLILSGVFDIKFLIIGLVSSIVIAWLTQSLLRLNSTSGQSETFLAYDFPYLKFLIYCLWLFGEIIKANIYVVKLVLNPKLPIDPAVITFKRHMSNPTAHTLLANSITLTPGTVTIDIVDDVYYVHAITNEIGLDLVPHGGDMANRVAKIFGEQDIDNTRETEEGK
jgi:multicomponent Na+:H+ antiporter subunit E